MEAAGLWVSFLSAVAALGAMVFAFVQAKVATDSRRDVLDAQAAAERAQEKAEAAQAEANRIAGEARDALGRSAAALEAANDGRWPELMPQVKAHDDGNSHWRVLPTYTRMSAEYRRIMRERGPGLGRTDYLLGLPELQRIADARPASAS